MLGDDQEVSVGRVECFPLRHVLASCENVYAYAALHDRTARSCDEMERVYPVNRLVEVEGVPA